MLGIDREAAKERGTLEFLPQGSRPLLSEAEDQPGRTQRGHAASRPQPFARFAEKRGQDHHQCCRGKEGPEEARLCHPPPPRERERGRTVVPAKARRAVHWFWFQL